MEKSSAPHGQCPQLFMNTTPARVSNAVKILIARLLAAAVTAAAIRSAQQATLLEKTNARVKCATVTENVHRHLEGILCIALGTKFAASNNIVPQRTSLTSIFVNTANANMMHSALNLTVL